MAPEGYKPVFAFSFCLPAGIFFQLATYIFDMGNDAVQIATFILHRDFWFAGFMGVFVVLSFLATVVGMHEYSKLKRFDPLTEARLSLARGVTTEAWEGMLAAERVIEAPSTGLIGPYGASLLQLTPLQAASCLYGLYSSAKAMAEGRLDLEVNTGAEAGAAALRAVRPVKAAMLTAWYFGAFAAELAAFAVASATLHPVLTLPGYLLGAVANGAAAWWSGASQILGVAVYSCLGVGYAMAGLQTKSFLKNSEATGAGGGGPGSIPALWILMRFISWTALCLLDLPQGLLPLGSLGRPMGLPVLREKFLEPAVASWEAVVCFTSNFWISVEPETNATSMSLTEEVGFGDCGWPTSGQLSSASTIFNTCLFSLAALLVPIHMCIVVGMLLFNPIYARAAENLELKEEVEAKQREINDFAERNEQAAGQHEQLSLLPN
ncbi:unnamed protein product [Symbiodinium necroappetens]|uniref:Uncharacterized protein n=1 Tax=Symbiodinium necroappetens TaxID=1628268 RepID=A0A812UDF5_9DINO|nr:unnamed protein product [Symbiodinium necroappetens]